VVLISARRLRRAWRSSSKKAEVLVEHDGRFACERHESALPDARTISGDALAGSSTPGGEPEREIRLGMHMRTVFDHHLEVSAGRCRRACR